MKKSTRLCMTLKGSTVQATIRAAFLLLLTLAVVPYAAAHAHLTAQTPAKDRVLTQSPETLSITFSEGIEPTFSRIHLYNQQDQQLKTGAAQRDGADNTRLWVAVEEPLAAGQYRVEWKVVSVDGHKTSGSYHFSVK